MITQNSPEISLALEHHREINTSGRRWARLEMTQFSEEIRIVRLYEGIIMSDGRKECCIGVRHYFMSKDEPTYYYSAQL